MAKAKKKPAKKPARKPARAKAKAKKAKPAKAKPAKAKPAAAAALSPIEVEVKRLLTDWEDGNIDNVWDVLPRTHELDSLLPRSSTLWKAYNEMSVELGEIARKSAMGED